MAGRSTSKDTAAPGKTRAPRKPRIDAQLRKARAIGILVLGKTYAECAAEMGISHNTIESWVAKDRDFREQLEDARRGSEDVTRQVQAIYRAHQIELAHVVVKRALAGDMSAMRIAMQATEPAKKHEHDAAPAITEALHLMIERLVTKKRARGPEAELQQANEGSEET